MTEVGAAGRLASTAQAPSFRVPLLGIQAEQLGTRSLIVASRYGKLFTGHEVTEFSTSHGVIGSMSFVKEVVVLPSNDVILIANSQLRRVWVRHASIGIGMNAA